MEKQNLIYLSEETDMDLDTELFYYGDGSYEEYED